MDTAQPSTSTTVQTEEQTEEKKRGVQEARQTSEPPETQHLVLRLVPKKKRQKKKVGCYRMCFWGGMKADRKPSHWLQGVQWAENVVDNEFMGKKKSKSERLSCLFIIHSHDHFLHDEVVPSCAECCIFHKQRNFGEWSDSEDSEAECEECNNKEPDS